MVCEMPVRLSHIGISLSSSLNPVASAVEAGVEVTCRPMSGLIDIEWLNNFQSL